MKPWTWIAGALLLSTTARGADIHPLVEYDKRGRATQMVGALKDGLFGEQVNLFNGATEFSATDIDVQGNRAGPISNSNHDADRATRTIFIPAYHLPRKPWLS